MNAVRKSPKMTQQIAQNGTPNDKTLIEWPPFENDRKLKLIWNRYIEVTGS